MNEKRGLNVMFAKSGSGGKTARIALPMKWIKSMDITEDKRQVEVIYNDEEKSITIKKK